MGSGGVREGGAAEGDPAHVYFLRVVRSLSIVLIRVC